MQFRSDIPLKPGYYWAKWKIAAEETHEGDLLTPSETPEIVEVWRNILEYYVDTVNEEEEFLVSVPGVRESQNVDCFVWGDFVAELG